MSSSARNRAHSINSGMSSRGRPEKVKDYTMVKSPPTQSMEPCAATASMFIYAQGNSIVCCHHDTLTIERRFSQHSEEVQLLAVDNLSDAGRGRLVVSYDAGQTAIVWDLMTGEEIARFASYNHLTCAAWMRSGNVAFGNSQGSVILFEPTTSEHLSSRTLDQIAVTSLAPAADCRTFAIGYQNGSLLVATIQPRFTILYSLSTSRAPSPIVNLMWHASSSRGKSEMLAVQTYDGDLRVWSVPKTYSSDDPAKVVRILKKQENYESYRAGPNWMGWSKNGRIVQFSDNETVSWDVRTKHVTSDRIPTLEHVRGIAVYGPAATLFTLGANGTAQQFDLNTPAVMVANVQHPANLLPPSPPISLEEQDKGAGAINKESESISIHVNTGVLPVQDQHVSPLGRFMQGGVGPDSDVDQYRMQSDVSSRSSASMSSTSSRTPGYRQAPSIASRGLTENTYISTGSSMRSSAFPRRERQDRDSVSVSSSSSVSMTSSRNVSRTHRPSRLRHEVVRSPAESKVDELFKFTRSRLSDVPHKQPYVADNNRLTNDDLRRQMLSTIFGWNKEVEDLVRDEMSRHPVGSTSRILLSKWLGDLDLDSMAASSHNMTAVDWMVLALNGMGEASQQKMARAYIQRLLKSGDLHTAATIMIGLGDRNDAIEIYDSHKHYMEALILTCLFFPTVWERQEAIIKRWGEWAVQHGQQQLAIRCMACTGKESSEPWTSPSAAQITFQSLNATIPEMLSPPLSPPGLNRGPQRSVAKSASLKLITTFGDPQSKAKYFLQPDDGQTPIAAAATPIIDSALSPGGFGDPTTALLRPSKRSAFNTPSSARPVNGFGRQRLPSIGEATGDPRPRDFLSGPNHVEELYPDKAAHSQQASIDGALSHALSLPRAATASPAMMRDPHIKRDPPLPSPSPASLAALMEGPITRNGPRSRRPGHLELQLAAKEATAGDITSPEPSAASSARPHWPSRRRGPGSVASSVTSASSVAKSQRSHHAPAKSLDDYIHSLDAAHSLDGRHNTRGSSRGRVRESSRTRRAGSREKSHERGRASSRSTYTPKGPKRSPTSPIPMSPEDLINLTTPRMDTHGGGAAGILIDTSPDVRQASTARKMSRKTPRETSRSRASSRARSRDGSRHRSPDKRSPALDLGGRSKGRESSLVRSPSLPLPHSANVLPHFYGSEDEEDLRQALEAKERFRRRNNRSTSQGIRDPASPSSGSAREGVRGQRKGQHGVGKEKVEKVVAFQHTAEHAGDLRAMKDERQEKKEAAARELEERRKSLARRPSAPPIPHPDDIYAFGSRSSSQVFFELPSTAFVPPTRSQTAEPGATRSTRSNRGLQFGLPATPKAMRLVLDSDPGRGPSASVPPMSSGFSRAPTTPPTNASSSSPTKFEADAESRAPLTLLPSTVYSPPSRNPIPRSMSAPPKELIHPGTLQGLPKRSLSRAQMVRKDSSEPDASGREGNRYMRRPSDTSIPPPPMLVELQHLAMPPPPPPAPLPHLASNKPVVYGGQTSGTIEIVMDDEKQFHDSSPPPAPPPPPPPTVPVAIPVSEATIPIIAPPAPPSSRSGHRRGRSSVDHSITGRISRATERMRSASRNRTTTPGLSWNKSSETSAAVPYESVQVNYNTRGDQRQNDYRTGLHQSEMI